MEPIYIINENELKSIVNLDQSVIEAIETGFSELQKGNATVPPIMMIPVPEKAGEVDVKSAYIKGIKRMAIKVASGFFENNKLGLPSASGQMLVLSSETGYLDGVLLDNGYLTQVRTGAAGAVAAKFLAPENAENVGVIGSGTQARFQMRALSLVRNIKTIRMFSLDSDDVRDQYVEDMRKELGIEVIKAGDAEEVVRKSSVVVTTTPARKGYLKAEWLHPGLHITAMGCDTEEKQELESAVLGRADVLACDLKSQVFRLGEMRSGIEAGVISEDSPIRELGEMINGVKTGRENEEQITVCDLTGVGVQDTMIAIKAYDLAVDQGMGTKIPR
ncbi:MAG: cyclodeaminase [Spirochaetaceae bacterium]|nr:cyclodeaminase [Spirochaetaceae bacterium]MCF7952333.1 cyclodeaminase [Spirochaetaceae bacterium]